MLLKKISSFVIRKVNYYFDKATYLYHRALMKRLLYYNVQSTKNAEKVVFWVPGGMSNMLDVEGAIGIALALRGHSTHFIICDGVYAACVKREISEKVKTTEWSQACAECKSSCSRKLEELNVPYSFIGDFVSRDEQAKLRDISKKITWRGIECFEYKGLALGKSIKSSVLRYLKGGDFPGDDNLVQEYAYSALICATAAQNSINGLKPSRVLMSHAVYVDWGPALQVALKNGQRVIGWMASYLPARFYLSQIQDPMHVDMHRISHKTWSQISQEKFTAAHEKYLLNFFMSRYKSDVSFDMKYFKPHVADISRFKKRYGLNEGKPVWGILAHINWDSVSDYAPMLFESFNEWIIETIQVAREAPDVQWLLKVHPAEAWDNPDTGVEALVRSYFSDLKNVVLIGADEDINPLDFYELLDGAVTVYGTGGLELAMQGKPVILAGKAHYGNKGFTNDPKNKAEYKDMLLNVSKLKILSTFQTLMAKKYAYCYFILRQIPISVVKNPNSKWWSFQFSKVDILKPGNDQGIDLICARIMDGEDFMMPMDSLNTDCEKV